MSGVGVVERDGVAPGALRRVEQPVGDGDQTVVTGHR
jgi:hypothetical protein